MGIHLEFKDHRQGGKQALQQGEVSFGDYSQSTHLGSCISIVVLSMHQNLGGLSHIVGRKTNFGAYNFVEEVLDYFTGLEQRYGPFEYYVAGGAESCRFVLDEVEREFRHRSIPYTKLDVLGMFYRNLLLVPTTRTLYIHKKPFFGD